MNYTPLSRCISSLRLPLVTSLLLCSLGLTRLMAESAPSGVLLVTNKGDRTLSVIDPATNKPVATIPEEGETGHELAASTDGQHAYVPIYGNSGVGKPGTDGHLMRIIDLKKKAIVGTVDFDKGIRPHCVINSEKNGLIYVTTEIENSVKVIDPKTMKIVGEIPTGQPESHMLAISHDGKRGYTANVSTGTISVLDLEAKKLAATIQVAGKVQRISVSPDDRWVFTSDQTKPQLAVIDSKTNEVAHWVPLSDYGYGTAPTPDGKFLLVCVGLNDVAVVDLESWKVVRSIEVPRAPQEILIRPDGAVAYVSCDASAKVIAIDLKEWKVAAQIDVGQKADGLAWAQAK